MSAECELRSRVEAKWRQCARLSATAMDADVRKWTDAFAKDLRAILDATPDCFRPGLGTAGVTGAQPDEPVTQAGRPASGGAG